MPPPSSRRYAVKEIFYSLQGEGLHTGRPAVFCRFAGCNLWSGREEQRAHAQCSYCDTDFVGTDGSNGGTFADAPTLAAAVAALWGGRSLSGSAKPYVILTGGEPMLQVDSALCAALHQRGFDVGIESNGSLPVCDGVDWICISPKVGVPLQQRHGHELKVVMPQAKGEIPASVLAEWESLPFLYHFIQPLDDKKGDYRSAAVDFCLTNPLWRLSLQTHKLLSIA